MSLLKRCVVDQMTLEDKITLFYCVYSNKNIKNETIFFLWEKETIYSRSFYKTTYVPFVYNTENDKRVKKICKQWKEIPLEMTVRCFTLIFYSE